MGNYEKSVQFCWTLAKNCCRYFAGYGNPERLQNGRGNAILVSDSIYNACRYYQLFQDAGFTQCAIVTSFAPSHSDIKGEETGRLYRKIDAI